MQQSAKIAKKYHHIDGHTIHQRIERYMRHHFMLGMVVGVMVIAIISFSERTDSALQRIYSESFSWISTHMHHEHPTHAAWHGAISRMPTISGGGADA